MGGGGEEVSVTSDLIFAYQVPTNSYTQPISENPPGNSAILLTIDILLLYPSGNNKQIYVYILTYGQIYANIHL